MVSTHILSHCLQDLRVVEADDATFDQWPGLAIRIREKQDSAKPKTKGRSVILLKRIYILGREAKLSKMFFAFLV